MIALGIDCGIRMCGVSAYEFGDAGKSELLFARLVRNPTKEGQGAEAVAAMAGAVVHELSIRGVLAVHLLGVETMQVYQGSRQKGDPNDLIPLAHVAGFLHAAIRPARAVYYRPREWKGQVPANECCRRVIGRLSPLECSRVDGLDRFLAALATAERANREVGGTDHNTIDGVGIGLKLLGRFEPRRVIAR